MVVKKEETIITVVYVWALDTYGTNLRKNQKSYVYMCVYVQSLYKLMFILQAASGKCILLLDIYQNWLIGPQVPLSVHISLDTYCCLKNGSK